jgi:6-pyruvoyltetrahydropterin/6-carboxytetrahydropterin synthase
MIEAVRYHDISTGHTVSGHESKCAHLHGHNYRVHFYCVAEELDSVGRVIDFSVIKEKLCMWIEDNWDHRFLICVDDERADALKSIDPDGVEFTWFNPTAENMAKYLVDVIGPLQLMNTGVTLRKVVIEETAKCSVTFRI